MLRSYSQNMMPSAKKFLVRSFCLLVMSRPSSARSLRVLMGISNTFQELSDPSLSGSVAYPALVRFAVEKASLLTMSAPPGGRSATLVRNAAGFMATSTSGASPGVWISLEEKLIWNPETPGSEPAGALISAG